METIYLTHRENVSSCDYRADCGKLVKITNSLHLLPLEMESVFPLFEVL
jgi:hypothetical protein